MTAKQDEMAKSIINTIPTINVKYRFFKLISNMKASLNNSIIVLKTKKNASYLLKKIKKALSSYKAFILKINHHMGYRIHEAIHQQGNVFLYFS